VFSLTLVQCASFCQTISHNAVVNVLISGSSCAFPSQGTCNHNGVNIIESQPGRGIVSPPKIIYRGISGRGCYLGEQRPDSEMLCGCNSNYMYANEVSTDYNLIPRPKVPDKMTEARTKQGRC